MTIGTVCNHAVITAHASATILEAATLMRQHHVGDIVVVKDHQGKQIPIGIVTDRDIVVDLVATELDCKVITVGDIMVTNLAVAKASTGILEAIQLMASKGVRRLPIVDNNDELMGIVTLDDVLLLLAKELGALTKLVAREQKNETARRR
jgi:CBS domain-containing protein